MADHARCEDFQREGQVALIGQGGSGGDECVRLVPGQQVESRCCSFRAARVKALPAWLPVSGALVTEPGDEVITADQVRHDCGGVIPEQGWQVTKVQDVRQRQVLADPGQRELVQLGESWLQAGQGLGGEVLCQRNVTLDELPPGPICGCTAVFRVLGSRSLPFTELEHLGQLGLMEAPEIVRDGPTKRLCRVTTTMFGLRFEQTKVDWVTEVRPMLLAAAAADQVAVTPSRAG